MKPASFHPLLILGTSLLATFASPLLAADNLLVNPGFEDGSEGFSFFIPENEEATKPSFEVSKEAARSGAGGQRLTAEGIGRYGFSMKRSGEFKPIPGDRYRVSAWVRPGPDFVQKANTPGFFIRVSMFKGTGGGEPKDFLYFGQQNLAARGTSTSLNANLEPGTWTQISGVFEFPEDANNMYVTFLLERGSGSLYVDDLSLTQVSETTPLTPLFSE
jgi:hypothetical protein